MQKPLVVKPTNGGHGDDVFTDIMTSEQFLSAVKKGMTNSSDRFAGVLVEEMFKGKEYRILANREKVIGVINRVPANVTGNGQHTIQQLIDIKNEDPRRGNGYEKGLLRIMIDEKVIAHLAQQQLTLESVPASHEKIFLRSNSNLSTGGDSLDLTDSVDNTVKELALKALQAIPGLSFSGIDFMTVDITKPQTADSYIIVEINSSPMISMHAFPYEGKDRKPGQEFLFAMFPELKRYD
jgi:glutamate--cysteine ligase